MLLWLRRWRERDDQHLVKRAAPLRADPITSYAKSSMKLKSATPKTNAGYIVQCRVIVLCLSTTSARSPATCGSPRMPGGRCRQLMRGI